MCDETDWNEISIRVDMYDDVFSNIVTIVNLNECQCNECIRVLHEKGCFVVILISA
jgi:hypothetical protein